MWKPAKKIVGNVQHLITNPRIRSSNEPRKKVPRHTWSLRGPPNRRCRPPVGPLDSVFFICFQFHPSSSFLYSNKKRTRKAVGTPLRRHRVSLRESYAPFMNLRRDRPDVRSYVVVPRGNLWTHGCNCISEVGREESWVLNRPARKELSKRRGAPEEIGCSFDSGAPFEIRFMYCTRRRHIKDERMCTEMC